MLKLYEFPIDITEHIQNFRDFLNDSYFSVAFKVMEKHDWENDGYFIQDWLQINWEILVERELLGFNYGLTQYKTEHFYKNILNLNRKPDFFLEVKLEKNQKDFRTKQALPPDEKLRFFSLDTPTTDCKEAPKVFCFDLVSLVDEEKKDFYLVPFDKVRFMLYPINLNFMTAKNDKVRRVCGFEKLEVPEGEEGREPYYHFCRCCGVEFGSKDCSLNRVRAHRVDWLEQGSPWYREDEMPKNWSAKEQLKKIPERYL